MPNPPLADSPQKVIGRHKEGVLLENSVDDDDRVRAHNIDDHVRSEPGEVVRADNRILVTTERPVELGLIFRQIVETQSISKSPVHAATQLEPLPFAEIKDFLN